MSGDVGYIINDVCVMAIVEWQVDISLLLNKHKLQTKVKLYFTSSTITKYIQHHALALIKVAVV